MEEFCSQICFRQLVLVGGVPAGDGPLSARAGKDRYGRIRDCSWRPADQYQLR